MTQSSHGLVRTIGHWSLTALMVNSIIGVSIFRLPSLLAEKLGAYSPLSCLAAGAAVLIITGCIAEVSSRYEETGGLYLYARDALGRFAGLLVAWLTWLTRIAAPAAAANLFCTYAAQFFPSLGARKGELFILVVLIGQLTIFNFIGVKTGTQLSNFFTLVKVGFLFLFVIAGLCASIARPEIRVPLIWPVASAKDWFEAMLLLVYAYGGFEGTLSVGGESTNPRRDTPIALLTALGLIAVIYTAVQVITLKVLPDAAASVRPLADASQRFLGTAGATAIAMAALVSAYGYLSANVLHAPRLTFALAEGGDFPAFFGAIHPRYRTPHLSIAIYALLVFTFAALGTFKWNAVLSAVSRLAVYGAMALAVPVLRSRHDGKARFLLPFPYFFAGFGLLFSGVLLTQMHSAELWVVSTTCGIAFLNWFLVRRASHDENAHG